MATVKASAASDPISMVTSAAGTAMTSVRDGAGALADRTRQALPAAGQMVQKLVYSSGYYVSYGIVFPTLFLTRIIPGGSLLVTGMSDGAAAASSSLQRMGSKVATKPAAKPKKAPARKRAK